MSCDYTYIRFFRETQECRICPPCPLRSLIPPTLGWEPLLNYFILFYIILNISMVCKFLPTLTVRNLRDGFKCRLYTFTHTLLIQLMRMFFCCIISECVSNFVIVQHFQKWSGRGKNAERMKITKTIFKTVFQFLLFWTLYIARCLNQTLPTISRIIQQKNIIMGRFNNVCVWVCDCVFTFA